MQRIHALALLAAAMLAVPAGFAAVGLGDRLLAPSSQPAATSSPGNVAKSWSGTVDASVAQGTLDLRTFAGPIHVQGVPGDAWSVQVLLPPKDPNALAVPGDGALRYDFQGEARDGVLTIALQVTRDAAPVVAVNDDQVPSIVATVPARLAWGSAYLCSAAGPPVTAADSVPGPGGKAPGCVQDAGNVLEASIRTGNATAPSVPFLVEGVHGGELAMYAANHGLATAGVRFANASLVANNGDLHIAGDFAALSGVTNNGAILAMLTNAASAKASLVTNNGDVKVGVPVEPGRGYAVDATTNNGAITIDLPDMEPSDGSHGARGAPALPFLAAPPPQPGPSDGPNRHVSAQSKGYADAPVQTALDVVTNNGNILVHGGAHDAHA